MSNKIKERRLASANVPEKNRAEAVNVDVKQKRSVLKGIILAIAIIVAVAALLLVVVNVFINNLSEDMSDGNYKDTVPDSFSEKYMQSNILYNGALASNKDFKNYSAVATNNHSKVVNNIKDTDNVFNYAIFGVEDAEDGSLSVDMIVIASVNKDTEKLTYVLIDATSLVYIPYANVVGQLKDAYNISNANLLARTISQNFGIDIDGYVDVKLTKAVEMIDIIGEENGGIELVMTQEEVDKLNLAIKAYNERFELDGSKQIASITKTGDKVTLDGKQTAAYIRGISSDRGASVFKVFEEMTKMALADGVKGINTFADILAENATTSTDSDGFSQVLQIAAKTTSDALQDKLVTIDLGKDQKDFVTVGMGCYFTIYDDYDKLVSELQAKLYSAE